MIGGEQEPDDEVTYTRPGLIVAALVLGGWAYFLLEAWSAG